jgi:peptide/nickel transport system permease protein
VAAALTKRLLLAVPTLFGMSIVVFALLRLVPGDPVSAVLGLNSTPALAKQMRHRFHLDEGIVPQYVHWLGGVLRGDFGFDYRSDEPITHLLGQSLPVTLELVIVSLVLAVVVAVPVGVVAAVRRRRPADRAAQVASMVGISIPDFWLGIMLILLFSLTFRLLPSSGWTPLTHDPVQNLKGVLLPAIALAVGLAAVLVRVTRAAMLDVLREDYIRFVRARGIGEGVVVFRHALRNAAGPVVTVIGMQAGYLVGGTIVVEQVFALPGIGNMLLNATLARNYPVVQATVLILGVMFVLANLAADLLSVVLNPRLRSEVTA